MAGKFSFEAQSAANNSKMLAGSSGIPRRRDGEPREPARELRRAGRARRSP